VLLSRLEAGKMQGQGNSPMKHFQCGKFPDIGMFSSCFDGKFKRFLCGNRMRMSRFSLLLFKTISVSGLVPLPGENADN
jgi:hypothetical protein